MLVFLTLLRAIVGGGGGVLTLMKGVSSVADPDLKDPYTLCWIRVYDLFFLGHGSKPGLFFA